MGRVVTHCCIVVLRRRRRRLNSGNLHRKLLAARRQSLVDSSRPAGIVSARPLLVSLSSSMANYRVIIISPSECGCCIRWSQEALCDLPSLSIRSMSLLMASTWRLLRSLAHSWHLSTSGVGASCPPSWLASFSSSSFLAGGGGGGDGEFFVAAAQGSHLDSSASGN